MELNKRGKGRPHDTKYIESPDELWDMFIDYKDWCKSNPHLVQDFTGKDATEVTRRKERALTFEGFKVFCMGKVSVNNYFQNKHKIYDEYISVCDDIKTVIRADQIEGGMAGLYNPNITQRLNNLAEITIEHTSINILNIDPLATIEIPSIDNLKLE